MVPFRYRKYVAPIGRPLLIALFYIMSAAMQMFVRLATLLAPSLLRTDASSTHAGHLVRSAAANSAFLKAKSALAKSDFAEAQQHLTQTIRFSPSLADAYYLRGHVAVVMNNPVSAIEDLQKGISLGYDLADAHFYLAMAFANLGARDEAIRHYEVALETQPRWAQAMINLAHLKLAAGEEKGAANLLQRAIGLDPGFSMAHQNLAALYDRSGYKPTALDLEARTELVLYDAYNLAGEQSFHVGKGNRGVELWTRALQIQREIAQGFQLPAEILQRLIRLPNIKPDLPFRILPYEWVTQIGHIAMLDSYRKIQLLGWRPPANLLLLAPKNKVSNPAYLEMWSEHFTIVSEQSLVDDLFPYQRYLGDCFNAFLHDDGHGVAWPDMGARAHTEWDKQRRPPLLALSEDQRAKGYAALKALGLPDGAWFVGLHAREGGYHREKIGSIQDHRNATIEDYIPAIQRVIDSGGWVVRMGDPSMTPLPKMRGVIDYAHSKAKSDWMDVFLCGAPRFFIGTTSGLTNAVISFGTPCILVNCLSNFSQLWGERVRFILKPFWSEQQKRYLKLSEIVSGPVREAVFNVRVLGEMGVSPVNNSPEDILMAVDEMLSANSTPSKVAGDAHSGTLDVLWDQAMNGNIMFGNGRPCQAFFEQHRSVFF